MSKDIFQSWNTNEARAWISNYITHLSIHTLVHAWQIINIYVYLYIYIYIRLSYLSLRLAATHVYLWTLATVTYLSHIKVSWWRHQMETSSVLLAICAGNSPVTGEFPAQRPVTRRFNVFFDLPLNKRLSKQWWGWWFETSLCPYVFMSTRGAPNLIF